MTLGLKKPAPLNLGDTVAVLAPASPVSEEALRLSVESVRFLGLNPLIMPSCNMHRGYLAGSDKQRAADINDAFANSLVKGIFCIRGGYGSGRILPLLNYDLLIQNPKVFVGYSDITVLHTAINSRCGFVTYHGPMPKSHFPEMDEYSLSCLKKNIFSDEPLGAVTNPPGEDMKTLVSGTASGIITGGNLALLQSTLGSPYEINTQDKILFIEDVGENPYKIDRALTSLALSGKFEDCAGIILGTFADCAFADCALANHPFEDRPFVKHTFANRPLVNHNFANRPFADHTCKNLAFEGMKKNECGTASENQITAEDGLQLLDIFEDIITPFQKPTLLNLRAGHVFPQMTIPMGAHVQMDAGKKILEFQ